MFTSEAVLLQAVIKARSCSAAVKLGCFVVKDGRFKASSVGRSVQRQSGLRPSADSECQCIPAGLGEPAGLMPFTLNWVTNPANTTVYILKGGSVTF